MEIPEGAVKVHMYDFDNILHPRGPMEKESLGLVIKKRLMDAYESWTDTNYGDSHPPHIVRIKIIQNCISEMIEAMESFDNEIDEFLIK